MIVFDVHEVNNHEDTIKEIIGEFEVDELPAGDFCIEGPRGEMLIERKEWTDFVRAYRSGALFNQLRRCMEQQHDVYLLIEGSRANAIEYAGAREYELRRMLTSLHAKFPVYIIETTGIVQTLEYLRDFEDWIGKPPNEDAVHNVRPTVKIPPEDRPRYIVEGLPSIGPKNAQRLLDEFGSVRAIFSANSEELQVVDGIGPKRADTIEEAIDRVAK